MRGQTLRLRGAARRGLSSALALICMLTAGRDLAGVGEMKCCGASAHPKHRISEKWCGRTPKLLWGLWASRARLECILEGCAGKWALICRLLADRALLVAGAVASRGGGERRSTHTYDICLCGHVSKHWGAATLGIWGPDPGKGTAACWTGCEHAGVTLSLAWLGCTGFREPCRPGPGASGAWGQPAQISMPLCGRPGAVLPLQIPSKQGRVTMSPCECLRGALWPGDAAGMACGLGLTQVSQPEQRSAVKGASQMNAWPASELPEPGRRPPIPCSNCEFVPGFSRTVQMIA